MREAEQHSSNEGLPLGFPSLVAAAHELKSPLSLIHQLALLMQSDVLSEQEYARMLARIQLSSERALRLTSDLTRAYNVEDTRLFELEPLNPQQVCRDVAYELRPLFTASGRDLTLCGTKRQFVVMANRDLLHRILANFGDNALHYTSPHTATKIALSSRNQGRVVRVGLRDYGPAVTLSTWKRVRDHVVQTPEPLHARPESSGLGLYLSQTFAGMMGGKIGVVRHRDGATFYIDLPVSRQMLLW